MRKSVWEFSQSSMEETCCCCTMGLGSTMYIPSREDADNDGNGADMTGQHESFNIVWILGWG